MTRVDFSFLLSHEIDLCQCEGAVDVVQEDKDQRPGRQLSRYRSLRYRGWITRECFSSSSSGCCPKNGLWVSLVVAHEGQGTGKAMPWGVAG